MESLARSSATWTLVAVLERDLSSAHQYLRIAGLYREAGNHDRRSHGRRGGPHPLPAMRAPAAAVRGEEYQRRERHADALRIVWVEFRSNPNFPAINAPGLCAQAEEWDDWRARPGIYPPDHRRETRAVRASV